MKVFILKDEDFDRLLAEIDRDPRHGERGGSSTVVTEEMQRVYLEAHRFYNYVIRRWLDTVKK